MWTPGVETGLLRSRSAEDTEQTRGKRVRAPRSLVPFAVRVVFIDCRGREDCNNEIAEGAED